MKPLAIIVASLFLAGFVHGFTTPPAWQLVEGKTIRFFKDKGFEFSLDDSMAHHYEKPTVEISIAIPERFTDAGLTNTFDAVTLSNKDISTELGTHSHEGKKRIILTMAEAMIRKSQVIFYFRNAAKDVTHGSMYVLDLVKVLNDWQQSKTNKPNQSAIEPFSRPITITVHDTNGLVYIAGQVVHPGKVIWTPGLTLTNAIALAGGFTDFADTRKLEIRHIGSTVEQYSYQQAVIAGTNTPQLKCGDAVNVKTRSLW